MRPGIRPAHLRWAPIALVAIGGAFGAASREGLSLVIPKLGEVPISIAIINVIGAFLLGCLYEAVTRLDSAKPTGKNLKLLLGTGYCGGFTTDIERPPTSGAAVVCTVYRRADGTNVY